MTNFANLNTYQVLAGDCVIGTACLALGELQQLTEKRTLQCMPLEAQGEGPGSEGSISYFVGLPGERPPVDIDAPVGKLPAVEVRILSASDLPIADFMGKSDPYVIVQWGLKGGRPVGKTASITQDLNPVWTDKERFLVNRLPGQETNELVLAVWDKDIIGSDDFLGEVRLSADDVNCLATNTVHNKKLSKGLEGSGPVSEFDISKSKLRFFLGDPGFPLINPNPN